MRRLAIAVSLFAAASVAGCSRTPPPPPAAAATDAGAHDHHGPPATIADWARGAKIFTSLGAFHRKVTSTSADAQKYFDQGMRLLWAFNHDESTRSFAQAATLDPSCALCFWGVALTVGPNYNLPVMAEPRARVAWEALRQAQAHEAAATPVEQALIGALAKRYTGPQPLDPSNSGPVLIAYANAMREVAAKFPADNDVQVLFAESLMNVNPWKLWTIDGKAAPGTAEIQTTLERVLSADATHPGANHYYIHAMEASPHPDAALASAERVHGMMPDAGHLQHMAAHIMQRVGRYEDASRANRDGVTSDLAYLGASPPLDYYGMYLAHNYQFLAYSAAMEGRKAEAVAAAVKMRDTIPVEMLLMMPGADWSVSEVYSAMMRFGLWDDILKEAAPDERLTSLTAGFHFARTVALAAKGRVDEANAELAQLDTLAAKAAPDAAAGLNSAKDVFAVANLVARGEVARAAKKTDEAVATLREAAAKEDLLAYDEPADWFIPVRHELGAVLLSTGKSADAEKVYRDDLVRHPHNGWALFGLAQALRAQHKDADAAKVDQEFSNAWKNADVKLSASVF
jgi:tetratricopeptide (TPR) repeat protein